MRCRNVREAVQEACDQGRAPAPAVQRHLEHCAGCRRFHEICRSYPALLGEAVDEELRGLGEPRLPGPAAAGRGSAFRSMSRRTRRIVIWAAAAALAVGIISPLAYREHAASQIRAYIRRDTSLFVDELLSARLLETDNGLLSDSRWFGGTEDIADLLGGTGLFAEPQE